MGLAKQVLAAARDNRLLSILQCHAGGMRAAAALVVAFHRLLADGRVNRDRAINTL
jgi:hypothetical protein